MSGTGPTRDLILSKFLIRIDKKTLRRNPHAGATRRFIPGPIITYEDGSQESERIEVSGPAPNWLYEFEDTEVECGECHKRFSFRPLLDDEDCEGNRFEVCPECGEEDCCDIIFETPAEAFKRKD